MDEVVFNNIVSATQSTLLEALDLDVLHTLTRGVAYVYQNGVAGDVAEFGTMSAKSAVVIATAVRLHNPAYQADPRGPKKAWFFDSFEGLPEPRSKIDQIAPLVTNRIWFPGSCKGLDESTFFSLIGKLLTVEEFFVRKGWFKETVPLLDQSQKFAMLHLDCDLYESTIDVLGPLFKNGQVSKGAIIFFDDWECNCADPDLGEKRAWGELVGRHRIQFSDGGAYGVAGRKYIVHEYSL